MNIDLDFFDVFLAITVAMGFGVAFYLANRHADKELIKEIREQSAIQLTRINDLDNAIADLKREIWDAEEEADEITIRLMIDKDEKKD